MKELIQKRSYVVIALAGILIIAWYVFVYGPGASSIARNKEDIHSLKMEIANSNQMIASAGILAQKVRGLEDEMNSCLDGICSVDSISHFIQMMEGMLRNHGIHRINVVPVLPDLLRDEDISLGEGRLSRVEFDISGVGRYLDIGKVIEQIEDEVFYAGCTMLDVSYKASLNPKVLFDFRLGVYLKGQTES
ncbi:MAG: hypothetical protein GF310_08755 [candidate division Zixibacteria bacterium]|nr:hypothetical protein [candidate division Zixibacteria bacterium]